MPGWQKFYQDNADENFDLISVAMDVQGAEKARPWLEKANASYAALVDRDNQLGAQFDFNYVPLTILFDEQGRVVRGPSYFNGRSQAAYDEIARWLTEGESALGKEPANLPFKVSGFASPEAELRFRLASLHLQEGRKAEALRQLKQALALSPGNYIILKQIWAIENPERFYDGPVDFGWQGEQLEKMAGEDGQQ